MSRASWPIITLLALSSNRTWGQIPSKLASDNCVANIPYIIHLTLRAEYRETVIFMQTLHTVFDPLYIDLEQSLCLLCSIIVQQYHYY